MDKHWKKYGEWIICRRLHSASAYEVYGDMLMQLHETVFEYPLERDQNRAKDGVRLRDEYGKLPHDIENNAPCSVLEMLAALSIRADDEWIGTMGDPRPEEFFWEMIRNLGLDFFDYKNFNKAAVDHIITVWMYRDFAQNGEGSPFPLRHPNSDQRDELIWSQMMAYFTENYSR